MQTLSIKQALFYTLSAAFGAGVLLAFFLYVNERAELASERQAEVNQLSIVATIYPLGEFARAVAGEAAQVTVITSPGVEPHDFEPTAKDIVAMQEADLLLINGGEVDAWTQGTTSVNGTIIMTDVVAFYEFADGSVDPHAWLDPVLVQGIVEHIHDALVVQDPDHAETYRLNTDAFLQDLRALDREYATALATCESHDIVVAHDAFGYLGRRYNFVVYAIAGLSPEDEPSAQNLAELTDLVREKNIPVIFFEELVSAELAQVIANETGARTMLLDPIENAGGGGYIMTMQKNLNALQAALSCQR